jgi:hypothetical protein
MLRRAAARLRRGGRVVASTPSLRVWTGLSGRLALNETVRVEASAVFWGAVGKEVDYSLVRESPVASWTRVAWMTHTGARGCMALEHAS